MAVDKQELIKLDSISNRGCSPETIKWAVYDLIARMRKVDSLINHNVHQARQLNFLNISCALSLCSLMGFPAPGAQDNACIENTIDVDGENIENQFPRTKRLGETQKQITNKT